MDGHKVRKSNFKTREKFMFTMNVFIIKIPLVLYYQFSVRLRCSRPLYQVEEKDDHLSIIQLVSGDSKE